jgi:hypothetical protein
MCTLESASLTVKVNSRPCVGCHADTSADCLQADTDLLSDRRARIEEWREWYEGKRAHREQMAAAAHKIISQRYPELVNKPDDYTIEQVGLGGS